MVKRYAGQWISTPLPECYFTILLQWKNSLPPEPGPI